MASGRGWHGDEQKHREAAAKGHAESAYDKHRRLASVRLEVLRTWDDGTDLRYALWFVYNATAAVFWGFFAIWFTFFGSIGRGLRMTGRSVARVVGGLAGLVTGRDGGDTET